LFRPIGRYPTIVTIVTYPTTHIQKQTIVTIVTRYFFPALLDICPKIDGRGRFMTVGRRNATKLGENSGIQLLG
jgi:hypothetical protein